MNRYAFSLVALLSAASIAHAQNLYVTADRTVANGNPVSGNYGTLNVGVTSGGVLTPGVSADVVAPSNGQNIQARSTSAVNLRGGSLPGFTIRDDARFTVSGGTMGSADPSFGYVSTVTNRARITVTGGTLHDGFGLEESAVGEVMGGTLNAGVRARDNTRLTVYSGTLNNIVVEEGAVADIYGGTFRYSTVPSTQSGSPVPVSSGINAGGTVNVFGGTFKGQNVSLAGLGSTLNVTGGIFGRIQARQSSTINISGGDFTNVLLCNFTSGGTPYADYNLFGTGFALTNARAFTLTDSYVNGFTGTMYDINGILADGSMLTGRYFVQSRNVGQGPTGITFKAPVVVVPEANTAALLALSLPMIGCAVVIRRRRRDKAIPA